MGQMQDKIIGAVDFSDSLLISQTYPKIFILTYMNPSVVMEAMRAGLVDGALVDALVARAFVQNVYAGLFKIVTEPLNDDGLYLVTMKDQEPLLIDLFNEGVKRMEKRGTYQKLLKKWSLYPEAFKTEKEELPESS